MPKIKMSLSALTITITITISLLLISSFTSGADPLPLTPTEMENENENDEWKKLTKEELSRQMNPGVWRANKTYEEVLDEFVQIGLKGTENARKILANELNVRYGEKLTQKFDVYGTDLRADSPIFFYIHGGYWQEGTKEISAHFAPLLYKIGVKTLVFGYTLAPNASIFEMQKELEAALVVAMEKYPSATFVLGGYSAGGQLCASVLTSDAVRRIPKLREKIKGILFLSGVYDLRPLVNTYVNDPLQLTLESARNLSALFNPVNSGWTESGTGSGGSNNKLKIKIMVGGGESPEFQRQSLAFYKYLKAEGFGSLDFLKVGQDDHFSIINNLSDEKCESGKHLLNYLQNFV